MAGTLAVATFAFLSLDIPEVSARLGVAVVCALAEAFGTCVGKPHCLRAHYGAHTGGCISTAASTQPGGHTSADLVTASLFSFLSFIFYVFNMQGS